jgi:hypothetical protein
LKKDHKIDQTGVENTLLPLLENNKAAQMLLEDNKAVQMLLEDNKAAQMLLEDKQPQPLIVVALLLKIAIIRK